MTATAMRHRRLRKDQVSMTPLDLSRATSQVHSEDKEPGLSASISTPLVLFVKLVPDSPTPRSTSAPF